MLMPIVNIPLIDYTLDTLALSGIEEVILFTCAFAEEVQKHVANSVHVREGRFTIHNVVSSRALSVGDALRDIFHAGVVNSEFILITGDVISNINFSAVLAAHKERYKADKNNIMTSVLVEALPGHHIRAGEAHITVAIDPTNGRLLSFQRTNNQKDVEFPLNIFQDRPAVVLREDLMESHVYMCSLEVLSTFADDFDYQQLDDLVRTSLEGDEIRDYHIHAYITNAEYAARVTNLHSYHAISQDIIQRWSYPIAPDIFSPNGKPARYLRNQVYLEDDVILARGCTLKENVVVGRGTHIGNEGGAASTISRSVIGRGCKIGSGVKIIDSYIWDGAVIGDNCTINGVRFGDDCKLISYPTHQGYRFLQCRS